MAQTPLDQPVSVHTLRQWYREGMIDQDTFLRALTMAQPSASWRSWLSLELLVAGVALVLSGIIFFFAYNWQEMGRFEKLGLIQGALIMTVLGAWRAGLKTLGGQVLMLVSSVMVGVFLAVFGQIYQTGADAYELFTGWAALTLIWVIAVRLEALWFLWLVIVQTGVILYWLQVMEPGWSRSYSGLFYLLAGINAAALVVREWLRPTVGHHWLRVILLLALLTSLTFPALDLIFDGLNEQPMRLAYLPIWLVVTVSSYVFFRYKRLDFACVSLAAADVAVVVVSILGRGLFSGSNGDGFSLFIVMSLIIVAATAGLTMWLSREYQAMKNLS